MRPGESQHLPCASLILLGMSSSFAAAVEVNVSQEILLSTSVHVSLNKLTQKPFSNAVFPHRLITSHYRTTTARCSFVTVPIPLPHFIDPQNKLRPLLTSFLSWWPLSLMPCLPDGASQHWHTIEPHAPSSCEQMDHEEMDDITWSEYA